MKLNKIARFINIAIVFIFFFLFLYTSYKVFIKGNISEQVAIHFNGNVDFDGIEIYRESFKGNLTRINYNLKFSYVISRGWAKRIQIKVPEKVEKNIESITVKVGNNIFLFSNSDIFSIWERSEQGFYLVPENVRGRTSIIKSLSIIKNWPGDINVILRLFNFFFVKFIWLFIVIITLFNYFWALVVFIVQSKTKLEVNELLKSVLLFHITVGKKMTKSRIFSLIIKYKDYMIIVLLSLLCWGGLFTLEGIWWDDWAWVWHYFESDSYNTFIVPFQNLKKVIEGAELYALFKMFEIFNYKTLIMWSIAKYITFTINSILIFLICKSIIQKNTLLSLLIACIYLVSPVVNNLCTVTLLYHLEIFFFLLSILFSIKAITENKYRVIYYILSIAFSLYTMLALGSYIFLDVVRPILVFYFFQKNNKGKLLSSIRKTMLFWAPFILNGFLILLNFILTPQKGAYEGVYRPPTISLDYISQAVMNYVSTFGYYFELFYKIIFELMFTNFNYLFFSFSILGGGLVYFLIKNKNKENEGIDNKATFFLIVLGFVFIFAGFLPYALVRGPVTFGLGSRHGILVNIGFCIVIPAIIFFLYSKKVLSKTIFSFLMFSLIFLSIFQNRSAVKSYSNDWKQQQEFWWQFTWRVPSLKKDTFLLVNMPREEYKYFSVWRGSYVFSGPLNLLYSKSGILYKEANNHFSRSVEKNETEILGFFDKKSKQQEFLSFSGVQKFNLNNIVTASFKDNYLELNSDIYNFSNNEVNFLRYLARESYKEQIVNDNEGYYFPLRWLLGPEPKPGWEYCYQKAKLYLSIGETRKVRMLYDKASELKVEEEFTADVYLPFIIAFYLDKKYDEAENILKKWALLSNGKYEDGLKMINYVESINGDEDIIQELMINLNEYTIHNY